VIEIYPQVDYKSFLLDFKSLLKAEEEAELGEGEKKSTNGNGKRTFFPRLGSEPEGLFSLTFFCGLYYKHITILIDAASVISK
jgi:hypothetical protein